MTSIQLHTLYVRYRTPCVVAVIVVATLLAMILRRPDQWAAPYVWIEEGTMMLPDFIANGWRTVFHQVNGYFLIPTKIIVAASATLSFRWMPQIDYWLTLAFTAGVLATVALAPTQLRGRVLCALAVLALPTDSEVFAMSSLAFWWGSLLVVLPLLWKPEGRQYPLVRSAMLLLGGLSSPLVIALLPLFALRAVWLRTRFAWLDLVVAGLASGIQASVMPVTSGPTLAAIAGISPTMFVRKFLGYFVYIPTPFATHDGATLFAGSALLVALIFCAWRYRRDLSPAFYLLLTAFLLAALASAIRQPLIQLHPALAGPRYFFLPFTFLFWAVLQLFTLRSTVPRVIAVVTMALVARNALDVGQRDSDRLDWKTNVNECIAADQHEFPIGYDGRAIAAWKVKIAGADCRRMVAASWFDNGIP